MVTAGAGVYMDSHGQGYCEAGYYGGWDGLGLDSQDACNAVCMSEDQCTYAAWNSGSTCSRYNGADCALNGKLNHFTYKKVMAPTNAPTNAETNAPTNAPINAPGGTQPVALN